MRGYFYLVIVVLSTTLFVKPILSQDDNKVTLTIGVRAWQQDLLRDAVQSFEDANPHIDVVLVLLQDEQSFFLKPSGGAEDEIDEYISGVRVIASTADLIPVLGLNYDVHTTRTEDFLNLAPLLDADPNAAIDDFYPAMFDSFVWDGGVWALPIAGNLQVVLYNQSVFDAASLSYPSDAWTMDNYLEAGRVLTQRDTSGNITIPGFYGFDRRYLFRALLGHPLIDNTNFLLEPALVDPELASMLESWSSYSQNIEPVSPNDFNDIPLTIGSLSTLERNSQYGFALLPNNTVGIRVDGYAISAGTNHPELAYQLLQFLTHSLYTINDYPARRSIANTITVPHYLAGTEMIDSLMSIAFSNTEMVFFDYLFDVVEQMNTGSESPDDLLLQAQLRASNTLIAIEDQSQLNQNIVVVTPASTPVLPNNEITLNFGTPPIRINRELWQSAIDDFVEQDSEVGHITVAAEWGRISQLVETQDCFYMTSNIIPNVDTAMLLPLDPLLLADPTFDEEAIISGVIPQVSRDSSIWALPFSLRPYVIWYNANLFERFNIPEPSPEWNISDFELTLQLAHDQTGGSVFRTNTYESPYLLMLMAAYGGHLIDYSKTPYEFNLVHPSSIEAATHVLSWVQSGAIDYQSVEIGISDITIGTLMFDSMLLSPGNMGLSENFAERYHHVPFPQGSGVRPISYELSSFYISNHTPYPQACYRLISFLSNRPELLDDMPVRRTQFDNTSASILYGDEVVTLFQTYDEILSDPDTIIFPSYFNMGVRDFYQYRMNRIWLSRAFDAYVLNDSNLEVQMEMAQEHIDEFNLCALSIGPAPLISTSESTEDTQARTAYFKQFDDCAIAVDPSMSDFLFSN
jgi:ABC-type glycerol-3-phosphate transport system substrate-binding protein